MDWASFFGKLIDKLDIKKIMFCAFIVLSFLLIPKLDFLDKIIQLDDEIKKKLIVVYAFVSVYIVLTIAIILFKKVKNKYITKPKKLFRLMYKYGGYINIYYSDKINEYTSAPYDLECYGFPEEIIQILYENNIIEPIFVNSNYKLTVQARKKLNKIRRIIVFIDKKVFKTNYLEENNNG